MMFNAEDDALHFCNEYRDRCSGVVDNLGNGDNNKDHDSVCCKYFFPFVQLKNYKTAASFARRLLELGPRPDVATQVGFFTSHFFLKRFC